MKSLLKIVNVKHKIRRLCKIEIKEILQDRHRSIYFYQKFYIFFPALFKLPAEAYERQNVPPKSLKQREEEGETIK